jgi:hypothetical protein
MRKLLPVALALASLVAPSLPAIAAGEFTVTAPETITYDPTVDGFAVSSVDFQNAPDYIQVSVNLQNSLNQQVDSDDPFRIAIGNECSFDIVWTNPATSESVVITGDNTVNLAISF